MILITRPINEAKILAKELKTFRLPVVIEPLTSFQYYKKRIILHDKTFFIVSSLQTVHTMKTNKRNTVGAPTINAAPNMYPTKNSAKL